MVDGRPTDGIRPTVAQVGALLASRGARGGQTNFTATSRPTADQVADIISSVASEIDAELVNVSAVQTKVAQLATWAITLAAGATVELTFFPEQGGASSTSAALWSRYKDVFDRLKLLIDNEGGGTATTGSARARSGTLASWDYVTGGRPTPPFGASDLVW